jgi:hypothetical protein
LCGVCTFSSARECEKRKWNVREEQKERKIITEIVRINYHAPLQLLLILFFTLCFIFSILIIATARYKQVSCEEAIKDQTCKQFFIDLFSSTA